MRLATLIGALAMMLLAAPAASQPVEVMVLGTWHFDNPGLDINNVRSDDVLKPQRQRELRALSAALARFRPTKVMVERVAATPDLVDPHYARFTPAALAAQRDERVQIGYRLAHRLGHRSVYAIDEKGDFPFEAVVRYAGAHGMGDELKQIMEGPAAETKAFEERQARLSIAQLLIGYNDPARFQSSIGGYYQLLGIGGADAQPGAELNAMWYLRNAKIFAKLMTVAQPGDRILVVYGAGHNYWLRHFASETPGFRNVDPAPYLRAAAAR